MRAFTPEQKALLRSDAIQANLLATFYLDEGTYYFCDDVFDLNDGTNTYIGANALADGVDVQSGTGLSAESVTLRCDGQRMEQAGIADPARVLRDMLQYLHQQRRVDLKLGLRYVTDRNVNIVLPTYAGKINNCRLVDPAVDEDASDAVPGYLDIELDALAARYSRATFRTRSHEDQLEIDSTDMFFSFVQNAANAESTMYWGKDSPYGNGYRNTVYYQTGSYFAAGLRASL